MASIYILLYILVPLKQMHIMTCNVYACMYVCMCVLMSLGSLCIKNLTRHFWGNPKSCERVIVGCFQ